MTWARRWLGAERIVSSDGLRGVVGAGQNDQRASADAFAVLGEIVARPTEVTVTHLSQTAVVDRAADREALGAAAATVEEQVGRYRALAEAGVQEAIVRPLDMADGAPAFERLFPVVSAFSPTRP